MAKPLSAVAAKRRGKDFAKQFVDEHAKGGIFSSLIVALFVKLITAFIESLLEDNDIIPKETA